jgi:hypothetical protein
MKYHNSFIVNYCRSAVVGASIAVISLSASHYTQVRTMGI